MKKYIVILIIMFVISCLTADTTGGIKGFVKDEKTNQPIDGASITIESTNLKAESDEKGYFYIIGVRAAVYSLRCEFENYVPSEVKGVKVRVGLNTNQDFKLLPQEIGQKNLISALPQESKETKIWKPEVENVVVNKDKEKDDPNLSDETNDREKETSSGWAEQDHKIVFLSLPKHSIIRIYTIVGDYLKTINHNGEPTEDKKEGNNEEIWDLLNNDGQPVAPGLYVFSVEDLDGVKDTFGGKFVIKK